MAYDVTLTQFVISNISINTDPTQLNSIQEPVNVDTEVSFTCRPQLTQTMQLLWWNVTSRCILTRTHLLLIFPLPEFSNLIPFRTIG